MADLTKCSDHDCPMKYDCHRYTVAPNPHRQSYFGKSPLKHVEKDGQIVPECEYFWDNKVKTTKNHG